MGLRKDYGPQAGLRQGYGPQAGVGVPHDRLGALSGSASLTPLSLPMGSSNGKTDDHSTISRGVKPLLS